MWVLLDLGFVHGESAGGDGKRKAERKRFDSEVDHERLLHTFGLAAAGEIDMTVSVFCTASFHAYLNRLIQRRSIRRVMALVASNYDCAAVSVCRFELASPTAFGSTFGEGRLLRFLSTRFICNHSDGAGISVN